VSAGPDTRKELGENYWAVSCTRIPDLRGDIAVYPEVDVSVGTNTPCS
jgi:hypothetical protein